MVAFPGCKINLGLCVTGRRPDGYHDLETCFYPVGWSDAVEVVSSETYSLNIPGSDLPPDENNTCTKAYRLLKELYSIGPVDIWLLKAVPHGAGLGGGSADGAATLKLLNTHFQLGLDNHKLEELALRLGSDCPFFIESKPVLATGKGEIFEPVKLSLSGHHIRILKPAESIGTAEAYRNVSISKTQMPLREIMENVPLRDWKNHLINSFEPYAFQRIPALTGLRDQMYADGALFAGMTGSGSAMFGIFEEAPPTQVAQPGIISWTGTFS